MTKNEITTTTTERKLEEAEKIFKWNFEQSVTKIKPQVEQWKSLTVEIAEELYIAREYLNGQIGQKSDPSATDYIEFSWADYCDAIGISKRTANNWLASFVPAYRSETGTAYLMTPEEKGVLSAEKTKRANEEREKRLAEYKRTGLIPEGWTSADAAEFNLREKAERHSEVVNVWKENKLRIKPRRDYFAEILEHSEDLKKFPLQTAEQNQIQLDVFDSLDAYLHSFKTSNERLKAAYNLSIKLKEVVNYYAELDAQNATLQGGYKK